MAYREAGAGDPLVLLHGFGSCGPESWDAFAGELAEHYRLIIPDLRGHGASTNPGGTFTHRQSARDVLALLDHLGVGRFRAIGISTGGMTLLHAATHDPARIEAMVLVGATTYFPEQARALMRGLPDAPFYEDIRRMYIGCATRGAGQVDSLMATFTGFHDSHDDMTFRPPQLATITARTLVVHGDRDEFFPVHIPVELYQSLPEAELWIIPGGGHVPIYNPLVPFVDVTLRFLQGSGARND
jgi:pimeloyl-ACP methyl ester carboxylesterase